MDLVNRERIEAVERLIRPYIRRTPVIEIDGRDFDLDSGAMVLKLELLQHSGSFKVRGTFANLLMREVPKAGVVAASGGNHGVAVAYAARRLNVPAKIFLPSISSPAKIQRIVPIDIPHPRDISSARYLELRDGIFGEIGLAHKV